MLGKQDITLKTEEGRFNYRVGGIIVNNGKVLLLTEDRFDFWYVPGGRAYLFETSEETIKREIYEELGAAPAIERILWTTECFYHFNAWHTKHHDLTFYYLVNLPKDSSIYSRDSHHVRVFPDGKTRMKIFNDQSSAQTARVYDRYLN